MMAPMLLRPSKTFYAGEALSRICCFALCCFRFEDAILRQFRYAALRLLAATPSVPADAERCHTPIPAPKRCFSVSFAIAPLPATPIRQAATSLYLAADEFRYSYADMRGPASSEAPARFRFSARHISSFAYSQAITLFAAAISTDYA